MSESQSTSGRLATTGASLRAPLPYGESGLERCLPDVEFVVRAGHSQRVSALAFSPDGRLLATASADATVKVWNVSSGALGRTLEKHYQDVTALVFTRRGRILAAASKDHSVSLWDPETGVFLLEVPQEDAPDSVVFDAPGEFFASSANDLVTVWNARTGSRLRSEKFDRLTSIAADTRANFLAVACSGRIEVQDFHTGRKRQRLRVAEQDVRLLAFSGDSARLTAVFADGTVQVWSSNGWTTAAVKIDRAPGILTAGAISPASGRVAIAKMEVCQWDIETGTLVARWDAENVSALAFSDDGCLLAEGASDGSVRVWSTDGDLRLWLDGYENAVEMVSLDARASRVAAVSASAVTVWDLQQGALRYTLKAEGKYFRQAEFHGSEGMLTMLSNSDLAIHDGATGRHLHTLWRGGDLVDEFAVDPKGKLIAAMVDKSHVSLWNHHGLPVRNLPVQDHWEGSVDFDPTGELLAVGGLNDDVVSVWEVQTGRMVGRFKGSFPVSFDPSGSALAVTSRGPQGGTAVIYNLGTGKVTRRVGMPDRPGSFTEDVTSLHISPSGHYLAASYFWGQVHIWDVGTGRHVGNIDEWTMHIAFDPANDVLAASHSENRITLWNASLQPLGTLRGSGARCAGTMLFDRTGRILVSGLIDGRVIVWSVARQQCLATFLPVAQNRWLTYTPEGYFIGSPKVEEAVSMYFARRKRAHSAYLLAYPRDNPNPDRVAAALALERPMVETTTGRKAHSGVVGPPPKLLGPGEP